MFGTLCTMNYNKDEPEHPWLASGGFVAIKLYTSFPIQELSVMFATSYDLWRFAVKSCLWRVCDNYLWNARI